LEIPSSEAIVNFDKQGAILLVFCLNMHRLGHYTIPEEMDEICGWLTSKLGLEGSSS
jgi:hypothetical protein